MVLTAISKEQLLTMFRISPRTNADKHCIFTEVFSVLYRHFFPANVSMPIITISTKCIEKTEFNNSI